MKLPFKVVCIDIETTDLDPIKGSVIQLGAVIADENFNVIKYEIYNEYIKPLDDYRHPTAMRVNQIKEEQMQAGLDLNDALELFENFCQDNKVLGSWGICFDITFLEKQYEKIGRKWPFSYKRFDLKTIAIWEMAKRGLEATGGVEKILQKLNSVFIGNPHDAADDIKNSVKILQILK